MAGYMTIELKGLRFHATHGMYAEERLVGNEFEVDVTVDYRLSKKNITSIEQTVNYMEIFRIVAEEMKERKPLLENCAIDIGEKLHTQFEEIEGITVSIRKLNPPISGFTGTVGVQYAKKFK